MAGMTLRTKGQVIRVRLVIEDKLSDRDKKILRKRKLLLDRRLGNSLAAAARKFNAVLNLNPRNASAHLGKAMAVALGLVGSDDDDTRATDPPDWKRAESMFAEIDDNDLHTPYNRSVFYVWYGFVFEQMGRSTSARTLYARASQLEEPYNWGAWAMEREEDLYLEEILEAEKAQAREKEEGKK